MTTELDPPEAPPLAPVRPTRVLLLALLAGQILLGLILGLVWLAWSPRPTVYLLADSTGQRFLIPAENENQVAADGRFFVLVLVAGLAAALVAWFVLRLRGPFPLIVLTVGSVLAAAATAAVGRLFSPGTTSGALNSVVHPKLALHAWPMLAVGAFAAALTYTVLIGLTSDPELIGRPTAYVPGPVGPDSAQPVGLAGPEAGPERGRGDRDGPELPQ